MRLLAALLLCSSLNAFAKDYGVIGQTYPIAETNMLEFIQQKLKAWQQSGTLQEHQEAFKQKSIQTIRRPKPVKGITRATADRSFTYDPTITVEKDIFDSTGKLIHAAGAKINPLVQQKLTKTLLFLDGDDAEQLRWAKEQIESTERFKLILVAGSAIELMKTYQIPFYFDQGEFITNKLGIRHVPASVKQQGGVLKIDEVAL